MRRPASRGYVLLLTLAMGSAVLALLFLVAPGSNLNRLQLGRETQQQLAASARSSVDAAMSALIYSPDFGGQSEGLSWTPEANGRIGTLSFDSKKTASYSSNNFKGKKPVSGWDGRKIPAGQVHLVGGSSKLEHQALVQPFTQVLVEDFNKDGNGGESRLPWVFFPDTTGHLCQNQYMFLGSKTYRKNQAQWMMIAGPRWQDYDLDAHVAYYGNSSFGFSMRTQNGFEGYRLELQPKIGLQKVDGLDATVTAVIGAGQTELPYPTAAQALIDPLLTSSIDLSAQPVEWTFRMSVRGQQLSLSVWDPSKSEFHSLGVSWDLSKFSPALQAAGYPASFDFGGIGVWSQVDNGLGVANVVVRLEGSTLIRVQSRWED